MSRYYGGVPSDVTREDEVARLVAGWQRALPEIDVSPLEVWSRVARLAQHLQRHRTAVFAAHELETWSFDVLSALRRSEPPHELSPSQLMAHTLVTSGTMTNRLRHLEDRGLIARRPDPRDARSVRVRLTTKGKSRVDDALRDLVREEDALMKDVDPVGRAQLAALLRSILAPLDTSVTEPSGK